MSVTEASLKMPVRQTPQPVRQLNAADLSGLQRLYDAQTEVVFSAELFPDSLFFGASDGTRMLAAGGTHALAPAYQIAVLGHILTSPEVRRQGYASAITAALADTLLRQQFSTIVLNVFADNYPAIRVYEQLGFEIAHKMVTGKAVLLT
jgi:predicted GNAT family acetyltransferase